MEAAELLDLVAGALVVLLAVEAAPVADVASVVAASVAADESEAVVVELEKPVKVLDVDVDMAEKLLVEVVVDWMISNVSDWARMPVFLGSTDKRLMRYLVPGAAAMFLKLYLPSEVWAVAAMTVEAMVVWSTSTMENVVGSDDTDDQVISLGTEKSSLESLVGEVTIMADTLASKPAKAKTVLASIFIYLWSKKGFERVLNETNGQTNDKSEFERASVVCQTKDKKRV